MRPGTRDLGRTRTGALEAKRGAETEQPTGWVCLYGYWCRRSPGPAQETDGLYRHHGNPTPKTDAQDVLAGEPLDISRKLL